MKIARRASPLVASAPDFSAIRFAGWPGFASDSIPTCQAPLARRRAGAAQVAAEVDEHGVLRLARGEVGDTIDRVFLADAAEVDLHAGRERQHR